MSSDRTSEGLTGAFVFAGIAIVLVLVGLMLRRRRRRAY